MITGASTNLKNNQMSVSVCGAIRPQGSHTNHKIGRQCNLFAHRPSNPRSVKKLRMLMQCNMLIVQSTSKLNMIQFKAHSVLYPITLPTLRPLKTNATALDRSVAGIFLKRKMLCIFIIQLLQHAS